MSVDIYSTNQVFCRSSNGIFNFTHFSSQACSDCLWYTYISPRMDSYKDTYNISKCLAGLMICQIIVNGSINPNCHCDNPNVVYNVPDVAGYYDGKYTSLEKFNLFNNLPTNFYVKTKKCCLAAQECCLKVQNNLTNKFYNINKDKSLSDKKRCPSTWDGWQCWGEAKPNSEERNACASYLYDNDDVVQNNGYVAKKNCTENGEWYKNVFGYEWTDYTGCKEAKATTTSKLFYGVIAYSISTIGILPAIYIFTKSSPLSSQAMFIIHKHLLISFFFYGFVFIFNYFFFTSTTGLQLYYKNHITCRFLFTIQLRYFRLTNFTWMLAEGVHLYRLLMSPMGRSISLKPYFGICWIFPLVASIIYSILRLYFENKDCWIAPSSYWWIEWTIIGPCLFTLCANLGHMISVLFHLVKKLKYNPHEEPVQYKKAVRAIFLLMPIFGLHFILTIYPIPNKFYEVASEIVDGLQGLFVAIIVCYTNRTVIETYKHKFQAINSFI
uniref:G_PROTEIN_RECEP_F2_4 domain-containing protein n=1 Tax=Strongyloides papillosus TaxID=174720 RepID=A0A0N5BR94_STREA